MKTSKRLGLWPFGVFLLAIFVTFFVTASRPGVAQAGVDDVLLGAVSSETPIDPGSVGSTNFTDYYTYNGTTTPSLTIRGNIEAQIGAIWTGGDPGNWREMRIIIDSNGDGNLDPFDWSDASHPWNRPDDTTTSWTYTYPSTYPDASLRETTITMTWDETCMCVQGFPWDTFQWWWYESDYDRTDRWWMSQGELMNMWWSGRDQEWNMLPNDDYIVQVWVDEDNNGQFETNEAHKTMIIAVETASITGSVVDSSNNPIEGAEVEAGSHMAWGKARTDANGNFTVSGLQAGATYHVRVQAAEKVTSEKDVELAAGETTASAGTITLSNAIAITGTLKLDRNANGTTGEDVDRFEPFENQWGWWETKLRVWVDAWNTQGPGWGNTEVSFEYPEEFMVWGPDGIESWTAGKGDHTVNFTINIPPPSGSATYELNLHVEGYAASINPVTVTAEGGNAGTIVLTKASMLTGSVKLPEDITEWRNIDVQAVNTTNPDDRYWGWGCIDPYQGQQELTPTNTGNFRIDGIPAGTFNLQVRVWGYAATTQEVVIEQGVDKEVGQITISEGNAITGTLTINGDTTNVMRWHGDNEDPMNIWIDAWSPSSGWSGTDVQIARGTNKSTTYKIGGLSSGTYEIHCWLGEGYELADENGNFPIFVSLESNATQNLVLKPFEGIVQGTITGPGTLDLSKVVVEVKRPWDWLPPKIATVANGGINPSTGAYSVNGLGTDDYVVKAGMYDGYMDYEGNLHTDLSGYQGEGWLLPNTAVGVVTQRVFVQNDSTSSSTLDIGFEVGRSISGAISLSTNDPPWHDINGDLNQDENEVITLAADLVGQQVMAMPMDMMFMGGQDPRMGTIGADGTYRIDGLAPGAYMIQPPFSSQRISQLAGGDSFQGDYFNGGEETHHWTVTTQMVVVTDSDVSNVNFTLGNGFTLTGTLTLPEAQTSIETWEEWMWVGHLELETATHKFMGHGRPLFKRDFSNSNKYNFTFNHVANGNYLVRFWTDRYVPGGAKIKVSNANTSVNLTIEEGANLVGKLVDADTGEAITSDDGVTVMCEAYPWVEGSWRETRDDEWSMSYIENDSGLMTGDFGGTEGQRENKTPGKFHLNALPTGYKYVIVVETDCHGNKTSGAKNYVGRVIAGIDIPEGATGDIDVGTIKLKEGTTIKGRLTDSDGNPVPGVEVFAIPSDTHDGSAEAEGISDTQGYYTVYGVDPDVEYYDLIAAERPFMFDDWGKKVEWGEKRKYNVPPGTTDANFTLARATATLSGTITIPEAAEFMLPFKGEGETFPAAYILLQKKGVIYKDMLDGIEGLTMPMPSTATQATYTIDNIEPGTYKIICMNYGLPTKVFDNVTISDGSNTKNVTWESTGYTVSGSCALSTGGYPSSSDISGVVCMNTADQSITFGILTQEADGTYSAYEVPGLADGQTYQLVFYKESGFDDMPDVFPSGETFTVSGDITNNTATITRNTVPILMVQAVQDPDDTNNINIGIFSTTYLVDESISVADTEPTSASTAGELYIKTGSGSLSNVVLSGDKRNIIATYTKGANEDTVELILAVHYGDDATTKLETLSFNANTVATNGDVVNIYIAGQVKLGNGDASQILIPAGSLETSDNGDAEVTIEKSSEEPGALALSRASMSEAGKLGVFARSALTALPDGVTAAGNQYDFSVSAASEEATVEQKAAVTVQIEYDPDLVSDVDQLNVWHLESGNTTWTKETTNRTVDTENHTISVDVTSLSPFIAGVGDTETGGETTTTTSGGGGGGCFISTAAFGSIHASPALQVMIVLFLVAALFVVILADQRRNQV